MVESHSLFAHILDQTKQNVELLITHQQISKIDGEAILSRLRLSADAEKPSRSRETSVVALAQKTHRLSVSSAPKVEARAVWKRSSEDPNDLTFEVGEIIEIIQETNAEWWTGRNRSGKQGVFPSHYVEKLRPGSSSPNAAPEPPRQPMGPPKGPVEQQYPPPALPYPSPPFPPPQQYPASPPSHYQPPPAGYYPAPARPPPGAAYPYRPPAGPPAPQQAPHPAPHHPPQQVHAKKSSVLGGLGQVMAKSAASGAGFGAGSAIGSGIVNGLF